MVDSNRLELITHYNIVITMYFKNYVYGHDHSTGCHDIRLHVPACHRDIIGRLVATSTVLQWLSVDDVLMRQSIKSTSGTSASASVHGQTVSGADMRLERDHSLLIFSPTNMVRSGAPPPRRSSSSLIPQPVANNNLTIGSNVMLTGTTRTAGIDRRVHSSVLYR